MKETTNCEMMLNIDLDTKCRINSEWTIQGKSVYKNNKYFGERLETSKGIMKIVRKCGGKFMQGSIINIKL